MRVTFTSLSDNLVNQLGSLTSQQSQLEGEVISGQQFTQLEDDPAAMNQVLNLQAQDSQVSHTARISPPSSRVPWLPPTP